MRAIPIALFTLPLILMHACTGYCQILINGNSFPTDSNGQRHGTYFDFGQSRSSEEWKNDLNKGTLLLEAESVHEITVSRDFYASRIHFRDPITISLRSPTDDIYNSSDNNSLLAWSELTYGIDSSQFQGSTTIDLFQENKNVWTFDLTFTNDTATAPFLVKGGNRLECQLNCVGSIFHATLGIARVRFSSLIFNGGVSNSSTKILKDAAFRESTFKGKTDFGSVQFGHAVVFSLDSFLTDANFRRSLFSWDATFQNSFFAEKPNMAYAIFKHDLDLTGSKFVKGIDLRSANLDSVRYVYLENLDCPDKDFLFDWDKLRQSDGGLFHIQLLHPALSEQRQSSNETVLLDDGILVDFKRTNNDWTVLGHVLPTYTTEDYFKLEKIYKKIYNALISQGDKEIADKVLYEMELRKQLIVDDSWWHQLRRKSYGVFFGFGYQPWRFLCFVVLPLVILFCLLWYLFYYPEIVQIIDDEFEKEVLLKYQKKRVLKLPIQYYSRSPTKPMALARIWHSLYFSAAVLLGIRFQKEWINTERRSLLAWITIEWTLGITLFVAFALLVKGSQFDYIKGLLGF